MIQNDCYFVVDIVVAGDHDVGFCASRMDVLLRHGQNGRVILLEDALAGASSLADVSLDAALKTNVFAEINEYLGAEQIGDIIPIESEETFDNDVLARLDEFGLFCTRMSGEIVNRLLNLESLVELAYVFDEQIAVQRVGCVEVPMGSLHNAEVIEFPVI